MRRAYTLTELLVVIVIMCCLVAAALPLVKMVMDGDRVRESSRQVQAFFVKAQTMAVQERRPVGVYFKLDSPLGEAPDVAPPAPVVRQCTKLYIAEVPPTYGGSTQGSRGIVRVEGGVAQFVPLVPVIYIDANGDGVLDNDANGDGIPDPSDADNDSRVDIDTNEAVMLQQLIGTDEFFEVRFDYKEPWFKFQRDASDRLLYFGPVGGTGKMPTAYNNPKSPGFPYSITRQPRNIGQPLELTGGVCIDMTYSGVGPADNSFIMGRGAIAVMLSPQGGIKDIYVDGANGSPAGAAVHLLLGRLGKMNHPLGPNTSHPSTMNMFDPNQSNLADATCLWCSIGRQTGKVTTAENAPNTGWTDFTATGQSAFIQDARQFAISGEQMAGN